MTPELTVIAGGPDDFLTAHHLVLQGANRQIGSQLAKLAQEAHATELAPCQDPLRIRAQRKALQHQAPTLHERMLGVADAFDRSPDDTSVDLTALFAFDLSVYAEFFGCSSAFVPASRTSSGHNVVLRNLDEGIRFAGAQETKLFGRPYVVEMYPDEGHPSLMVVAIDLLSALDGINSQGLVVTYAAHADYRMTEEFHWEPTAHAEPGLNELQTIRYLLDTCANVEEAKEALLTLRRYYWFEPMLYQVADRNGDSFVCETSKSGNLTLFTDSLGEPQVMTNFGLHRFGTLDDVPTSDDMQTGFSFSRFRILREGLDCRDLETDDFKALLAEASFDRLCPETAEGGDPMRSVWSAVYDIEDLSLDVSFYLGEEPERSGTTRSESRQFRLR
ncbi:C45 family autoproteolytic acyltransferase/hydrolase [Candidatus Bipolaricaulota bacterium]